MTANFNTYIERRKSDCAKWGYYPDDVLPLWVADMDFRSPEPVIAALHERIDHGIFGYQMDCPELRDVIVERLRTHHNIDTNGEAIQFTPGLVYAVNTVSRAIGEPGSGILVQTPAYPPFLSAPHSSDRVLQSAPLALTVADGVMHYEIDFEAMEAAVTPETRMFILCNPHNPVGRAFTRAELEGIAEFCLRHDLIICSDEIHCDLVFEGYQHISIASLSPEIADRCVTLLAPSKTYNIPGFGLGFAVIQNEALRQRFHDAAMAVGGHPSTVSYPAAVAAYTQGQEWLDEVLVYLEGNRDLVFDFAREVLPEVPITQPEATYLTWLDFRPLNLDPDPYQFFLDKAKVAFSNGQDFDAPGFLRINFATTRDNLNEALDRVRRSLGR